MHVPLEFQRSGKRLLELRASGREQKFKAKGLLGWEPKVPIDAGLKRTIPWIHKSS